MCDEEFKTKFRIVVERIFNNWINLKLAVEHGMGGRNGQKVALEFLEYVYNYCIEKQDLSQDELIEVMEDIMDQEFDTICEDSSIAEIVKNLLRYKQMALIGNYSSIEMEISMLPNNQNWLHPNCTVNTIKSSDSSCSESSESEMDVVDDVLSTSADNMKLNEDVKATIAESDSGWTIVKKKK